MALGSPVDQLARSPAGDLHGAQDAYINVPAANHCEAVGMMKIGRAGNGGDGLFSGVDQFGALASRGRSRAHAQQAILGVKNHLAPARNKLGDQFRHADAEVDAGTIRNVLGDEPGHGLAAPFSWIRCGLAHA